MRRPPLWRTLLVLLTVGLVVAAVVTGVRNRTPVGGTASTASQPADHRTLQDVLTHVSPAVTAAVGGGGTVNSLVPLTGAPPLAGPAGKPQVLFVGAESCGICAAQRWSMVIALGRFGTLKSLLIGASPPSAAFPGTATFSFRTLTYTSAYIDLVAVETLDSAGKPLGALTAGQQALLATYDAPPYTTADAKGDVPWLDVGNRYGMAGAGFSPAVIQGLNWGVIAQRLANAKDPVTQAVLGSANRITAAICRADGMQPASVCQASGIRELAAALP